jgi:uncharacterized repeat protein (TIGR01451 family)
LNRQLSVRETTVARAFADRAGRVLAATLFVLAIAMAAPMLARAANPAANIDQCRNGTIDAPVQCINSAWENGNLGPENSHYREGDSVPFRAVMTNLDTSITHTLVIQYDTLQSGKHAYDYLTSYNASETNANPTADVSGTTAGNCFPIPVDLTIAFANPGSTQEPGCISIWNGTITSVSYGTADASGQRSVIVTFTATDPTVVIAWGGHIASQIDWGAGNSASAISGSPYHMRLLTLDDTQLGNQDRSLKASGILPIPAVFTTQASPSSITLGQSVTDTATLSGSNGAVTGTVKFFVCGPAASNPDCTFGGTQVGGAVTISAGQAVSDVFTPTAVGHYCFRGEYTPDAFAPYSPSNHTDQTLECFTVNPVSPTLTTNAGGPVTLGVNGSDLTDSATLSGGTAAISGTITFRLYSDASCTTQVGSDVTKTVSGNGVYVSPVIHVDSAGTYHWVANYGGDANNSATTNGCNEANENVVVNPRDTSLTTDAGGPFRIGESGKVDLSDTATLSGATSNASGTITFHLYLGADCSPGNEVAGSPVTNTGVSGAGDYASPAISVSQPGVYHWVAGYGGDTNNNGSASSCGDENENPLVIQPHISVSKTPDEQVIRNGDNVSWTIQVINDGTSTLTDVTVADAEAPGCARTSADVPELASMAPGETVTYTCTRDSNTASFTNVAVATGTPEVGENVSAEDTAHVTVINPAISVSKTPDSQTVAFNGTVTFTIEVTNTGDATLTDVHVTDALAPGCARTKADVPQLASMAPGDHLSYTCTLANVISDFTNIAVATGTPPVGPNVSDSDTAAVTVGPPPPPATHPAISIVKNPKSQTITSGGTATFTITVTNTGDVTLTDVAVTDALSPNCDRTIGTLARGASTSYTCSRANVKASFNNVAVVTGKAGATTVTAQDTAPVTAKAPFVPKKVKPKVVSHKKPKATG